jgi:acyl-CoA thioesterase I
MEPIARPLRAVLASLAVLSVAAACGAPEAPNLDSPGTTIVCLGDSITYGVGAGSEESYPTRLAERLGVPVINAGVPGDTTAEGLARLDEVLAHDPWLVIIELGGNDLLRRLSVGEAERNLRAVVEGVLAAGAVPVLVELDGGSLLTDSLADVFEGLHEEYRVPMVEGVLDDVLRDGGLRADHIHPNAAGYRVLAEGVAEVVEPLLRARRERVREGA